MVGDFVRLSEDELNRLVDLRVRPGDGLYEKAYAAHLVTASNQKAQRQLLAARLRSRMSFLHQTTPLSYLRVVTLRCEHSCPYCQVSRQSTDRSRFDMSEQTAMRALDIAFASPAARIKIEFQGGEPLLNFPLIAGRSVAAAKQRSRTSAREPRLRHCLKLGLVGRHRSRFLPKRTTSLLSTFTRLRPSRSAQQGQHPSSPRYCKQSPELKSCCWNPASQRSSRS